jgi:hydroxypyruvate reductase 2
VIVDLIDALPALELVVASSVGVDHIDLAACRDYAVGLVVVALRRVAAADAYILRHCGWAAGHGEKTCSRRQGS